MPLIKPFRALRPAPGRAAEVLAPPYDVLSSVEARTRAQGKPFSFLHISKPEIDLDPAIDPHDPAVYAKAADNLKRMVAEGVMMRDAKPSYYVYRLSGHGRTQTGLACVASLADYATNRIRKHELTTPVKEDDRVHQIEAVNAQTGPVMMGYPAQPAIDAMLAQAAAGKPEVDVTADDGVRHQLWVIADSATIDKLTRAFDALPAIYIGDGHHRSAAAARAAAARKGDGSHQYFLSVIFPEREMTILDYNRVVKDLNGRSAEQMLAELAKRFTVTASQEPVRPQSSQDFGMYLAGGWYRLSIRPDLVPKDPIGRLPITLLTRNVIEPLLGIKDPRTDKRIDFIGGARGLTGLEARVKSGEMAVAFALYPTQMADLMAVADAGGIMPPKSTWFEPKLADGMVNHVLD
ncbi:MAG: DUF1015 domain-containing protein [Pseudolabrys sp.]|nr:DUF1015 domain-containing protein [Pseudolabrys sp.]MSP32612.1 DUF1015 domain-containing protein [Pseudolabrys sp.]